MKIGGTELQHSYQFSFLKWGLINPSRPPFSKGGELLGDEGGFDGFARS
jgi:hypothetical protein